MLLVSAQKPGQVEKDATSERTKARSWWRSVLLVSAQKPGQRAADWGRVLAFSTYCTIQPLEADLLSAQTAPHNHWKQTCFQHILHHTTIGSRPAFSTDCPTQPSEADLLSAHTPPHNHWKQTCFCRCTVVGCSCTRVSVQVHIWACTRAQLFRRGGGGGRVSHCFYVDTWWVPLHIEMSLSASQ